MKDPIWLNVPTGMFRGICVARHKNKPYFRHSLAMRSNAKGHPIRRPSLKHPPDSRIVSEQLDQPLPAIVVLAIVHTDKSTRHVWTVMRRSSIVSSFSTTGIRAC